MTKTEARIFSFTNLFIAVSGSVYFVLKYFFKVETEYGIRPHAQTGFWLGFHVITVPLLLMVFGYIFKSHVLNKILYGVEARKWSGYACIGLFLLMVFSGYILQLGLGPQFNEVMGILHLIFSYTWVITSLWHLRLRF
jgi:hypothetical protein